MTRFRPSRDVPVLQDHVLDIADAANQFAPIDPPATVAGFPRTAGRAASVYGSGLTRLLVVPLPPREAADLAHRLAESGAPLVHGQRLLRVGPLGVMVTRGAGRLFWAHWLLAGTLTDDALLAAASDLETGAREQ